MNRLEAWFGAEGSAAVPGTHILADVTPKDVIAEGLFELSRGFCFCFDGPVADALGAIEFPAVWAIDNCSSGAGIDAASAGAAAVWGRAMETRDGEGKQKFSEEEPTAAGLVDEAGILADPAKAGFAGIAALEQWSGVDTDAVVEGLAEFGCEAGGNSF